MNRFNGLPAYYNLIDLSPLETVKTVRRSSRASEPPANAMGEGEAGVNAKFHNGIVHPFGLCSNYNHQTDTFNESAATSTTPPRSRNRSKYWNSSTRSP